MHAAAHVKPPRPSLRNLGAYADDVHVFATNLKGGAKA